ncbi:APA family fibronectin-binding glycoprotein [Mycolicibacterium sp.]|uniref:APA family fibronectin-binding glycoprotein n=1 Tax=Mycolicibacterium sp. TaxID=2320850 RepID=UPI001A2A8E54|nr:APA family fibronectin-binding glycoprotein [Mycolicibacterium sp.]MBJ7398926.1 hypothetical protein [Mycolicibacterium sp.]
MTQPEPTSRRPGLWTAFAVTAVAGASAITIALPPNSALADPVPPATTTAAPAAPAATTAASAAPVDPNAPPPAPVDPNAPPPPPELEPGRVTNSAGGFSYLLPAGWEVADASRLSYGQALLLKQTAPAINGQPAPTASDTSILLGRLDLKLFAGAEQDNGKAAIRLASDMGEFFMPFPGTRINQQTGPLQAGTMPGAAASYDVKFSDASKPNGQIWAGVVGTAAPAASRNQNSERWFVVYLGTAKDPVDVAAAKALAQSIKPYTPPPPPPPDPNALPAPAPVPGNRVGVPIPVETPVPEMMPGG